MNSIIVDETDLNEEFDSFHQKQNVVIRKKFEKWRINVHFADGQDDVYRIIDNFIREREYINKISFSDSVTLYQLDVFNYIKKKYCDKDICWPLERSNSGHYKIFGEQPKGRINLPYDEYLVKHEKWYKEVQDSIISDLTIIGANAITKNGEIVSVDGLGNRVSSMIFGPRHVIIVVGRNKIVNNVESALDRIHNHAAPLTYLRHANKHYTNHMNLPCVQKGRCVNCSMPESACMNTVIVRGQIHHHSDRIHLIIVDDDLGF